MSRELPERVAPVEMQEQDPGPAKIRERPERPGADLEPIDAGNGRNEGLAKA